METNDDVAARQGSTWPLREHVGGLEIEFTPESLSPGWARLTISRSGISVCCVLSAEQLDCLQTLTGAARTYREQEQKGDVQDG